jgi:hypothetical protein
MTAVSVKVPRQKLIDALQASLDKELGLPTADDYQTAYTKFTKDYQAAVDKYNAQVVKAVSKNNGKLRSLNVWRNEVTVNYEIGETAFPEAPSQGRFEFKQQDIRKIKDIQNAITILNLSEEDFVNASTYKSVVGYL